MKMELLPVFAILLSTSTFTYGQAADGFRWSQPSAPRPSPNLPPALIPRSERRHTFFPPGLRFSSVVEPILSRPRNVLLSRPPSTPPPPIITTTEAVEYYDEEDYYDYYTYDENSTGPTGTGDDVPTFTSPRSEPTGSHFGNTGFRFSSRPSIIGFTGRPATQSSITFPPISTRPPFRFGFPQSADRNRIIPDRHIPDRTRLIPNTASGSRLSLAERLAGRNSEPITNNIGPNFNDLDSDREARILSKPKSTTEATGPRKFKVTNTTASTFSIGSVQTSHSIKAQSSPHVGHQHHLPTTQRIYTDEPFYDTTYNTDYYDTTTGFVNQRSEGKRILDDDAPSLNLPEHLTPMKFNNIQIAVDASRYKIEPEIPTATSSSPLPGSLSRTTIESIFSSLPQEDVSSLLPSDYLPSTEASPPRLINQNIETTMKLPTTTFHNPLQFLPFNKSNLDDKNVVVKAVDPSSFLPADFKTTKEDPSAYLPAGFNAEDVEVVDPLSFLPAGFKPIENSTDEKLAGIIVSTIEVDSKFLPPGFKTKNVDPNSFLPPGFKTKNIDSKSFLPPGFSPTEPPQNVSTTTEKPTTKRGRLGIVFAARPNRPAFLTTTSKPKRNRPGLLKPKIVNIFDRVKALASTEYVVPVVTQSSKSLKENKNEIIIPTTTTTTTTSTTTTTTTTTTRPLPTTPGICTTNCILEATLRLINGAKWQPALANRETREFESLANELEDQLNSFFLDGSIFNWYKSVKVDSFNEGSVIVSYILNLEDVQGDVDTQDLKDKINVDLERISHSMGKFTFDPKGTDFRVVPEPRVALSDDKDNFLIPEWLIAVIVIGLASFLFILIFGIVALVGRTRTRKRTSAPLTQEYLNNLNVQGIDNYPPNSLYDMDAMWNEKYQEKGPVKPPSSRGQGYIEEYNVNIYDSWRTDYSGPYTASTANNSKRRPELDFDGKQFYKDDPYDF